MRASNSRMLIMTSATMGSNWTPLFRDISCIVSFTVSALRYGRSERMASVESATAMIRAPRGISSPFSPLG